MLDEGTLAQPQMIEVPVEVSTAGKREFAIREKRPNSRVAEIRSYYDEFEKSGHGPVPAIWIDWAEIEGPLLTPGSFSLTAATQDSAGARDVLERFARHYDPTMVPPLSIGLAAAALA